MLCLASLFERRLNHCRLPHIVTIRPLFSYILIMSNANPSLVASYTKRLALVESQISSACQTHHRAPASVCLMAVTKTHAISVVQAAFDAGMRDFGENYVQEGVDKIIALQQLLPHHTARWHFIGPIQSNKTRLIAKHFDWAHSVDRLKVAQRLSEQRPESLSPLNICLQVNISDEPSKSGCTPSETRTLALAVSQMPHLRLRGLMAIPAPLADSASEQEQQAPFLAMHQLFNQTKSALPNDAQVDFDTLSMGMSADYQHAIAGGATMVRIGSALFGERT